MTASAASSAALRAATRLRNSQRARYPRASACNIDRELKLQAYILVPPNLTSVLGRNARPQGLMTASAASYTAFCGAMRLRSSQRARYPRASACDMDQELKLRLIPLCYIVSVAW